MFETFYQQPLPSSVGTRTAQNVPPYKMCASDDIKALPLVDLYPNTGTHCTGVCSASVSLSVGDGCGVNCSAKVAPLIYVLPVSIGHLDNHRGTPRHTTTEALHVTQPQKHSTSHNQRGTPRHNS